VVRSEDAPRDQGRLPGSRQAEPSDGGCERDPRVVDRRAVDLMVDQRQRRRDQQSAR
jgi:hypothetical protein